MVIRVCVSLSPICHIFVVQTKKSINPFHEDRNLFAEQKERLKRHQRSTALCRTDVKGPTYQIIRRLAVIDSKSASYPFVASQIHVSPIT
jgi:hypothetical protein